MSGKGRDRWYDPVGGFVLFLILVTAIAVTFGVMIDAENRKLVQHLNELERLAKAEEDAKFHFLQILERQVDIFNRAADQCKAKLKECDCDGE